MSDLTRQEMIKLERLLGMDSGYVLGNRFSDRTFGHFVLEVSGRDPYGPGGDAIGTSKANRLRLLWKHESNFVVAKVLGALIDEQERRDGNTDDVLRQECRKIVARLQTGTAVCEADAFAVAAAESDFEMLAREVLDAINKNQPEAGLDRLHTFVTKFLRARCADHEIPTTRDEPLHSIFGKYVKGLRAGGHLHSPMTDRILRANFGVMQDFNDVRNQQSLAHDNKILNYEESRLIFNHVASLIRFLQALEAEIDKKRAREALDTPF